MFVKKFFILIMDYLTIASCLSLIIFVAPLSAEESQAPSKIELIEAGSLHVLFQPTSIIAQKERKLVQQFAEENQLTTKWLPVTEAQQLTPRLINGSGDIIIGHSRLLAAELAEQIKFTHPLGITRQQLVTRVDTTRVTDLKDILLRQIALQRSSPLWPRLEKYLEENPTMSLVTIPGSSSTDEIMQRTVSGLYDLSILENNILETHLPEYPELAVIFDFSPTESHAWALRENAEILKNRLNEFLNRNHLSMAIKDVKRGDLPKIKRRGILRLITYQSPENYFFNNGKMHGFEYGLIKKFSDSQDIDIDIILANSHTHMRELLLSGNGDIIAASLPVNSLDDKNISMTRAYNYSSPVVIGRATANQPIDIRDIVGKKIALGSESPYKFILQNIKSRGIDIEIIDTGIDISTEEILDRISQKTYDLTILSNHQIKATLKKYRALVPLFNLSQPVAQSWAVRTQDHKLLAALNNYIAKEYRSDTYNLLYGRYLFNKPYTEDRINSSSLLTHRLSPYDELVKMSARQHDFDWRLILAQMYQESQFDPDAISSKGAEGLMQIMPDTAHELGIDDLRDPSSSIKGGVKYMRYLRDQFEQTLPLEEKTWFTLAAYNAGFNRVKKARKLATEMGLDSNHWFDNVEHAMLAMTKPYTRGKQPKRLCNCTQTISYVQGIRSLYHNYVQLTETPQIANIESKPRGL